MITERIIFLLEKCNAGSLNVEEQQELDNWYQEQQIHNAPLYDGRDTAQEEYVKESMFGQLMDKLNTQETRSVPGKRISMQRFAVAASLLIVTGVMLYWLTLPEEKYTTTIAEDIHVGKSTIAIIENTSVHKQSWYLADSSKVTLSPGSAIRYDSAFKNSKREIHLDGEAYFNVKTNARMPFSVSTNHVKITALGTSFTVTSFKTDSLMRVKLHEGRVMVQADTVAVAKNMKPVYLKPGDELNIHPVSLASSIKREPQARSGNTEIVVKKKIMPVTFHFEQEALSNVLDKLATHYNILITYDLQEIRDLDFSGTLKLPDNVLPVLQKIAFLNGLTVTNMRNGFYLTKK
jgi:transmembrane sensor